MSPFRLAGTRREFAWTAAGSVGTGRRRSSCVRFPYPGALRTHGPPSELERVSASFSGHLSRGALPGHVEEQEDLLQPFNRQTGHRIKYLKVDADTGDEVPNEDIVKGYELDRGSTSRSRRKSLRRSRWSRRGRLRSTSLSTAATSTPDT